MWSVGGDHYGRIPNGHARNIDIHRGEDGPRASDEKPREYLILKSNGEHVVSCGGLTP